MLTQIKIENLNEFRPTAASLTLVAILADHYSLQFQLSFIMTLDYFINTRPKQIKAIKVTGWTISALELMYGSATLDLKLIHLRTLKHGTVGREIAEMLDHRNYRLIPKFENHDLKHIILDYEMTMKDEIRMQACRLPQK